MEVLGTFHIRKKLKKKGTKWIWQKKQIVGWKLEGWVFAGPLIFCVCLIDTFFSFKGTWCKIWHLNLERVVELKRINVVAHFAPPDFERISHSQRLVKDREG